MSNNMKEINLFSKYETSKPKTRYDMLAILIVFAVVAGFILLAELDLNSSLSSVNNDIALKEEYLSSTKVVEATERIDSKTNVVNNLVALENSFKSMDSILHLKSVLHVGLFNELNSLVPEFVYITSLNMSKDSITINGYADGYRSVGEFEHNIRNSSRFSDVSVPSISNVNGNYSFSMTIQLNMEG